MKVEKKSELIGRGAPSSPCVWIRIQHKMKYKSQIKKENNFLGNNAASNVNKARLCTFFTVLNMDPISDMYPEPELQKIVTVPQHCLVEYRYMYHGALK
jgi:hypothetical protein